MKAIFVSDLHISDPSDMKTQLAIRFFEEKASQFEQVYILGDLFDSWPATNSYLKERFRPVTDCLRKLVDAGHKVHYFEGNHDFHLGKYFTEELGIQVYPEATTQHFGNKKAYVAHGDLGNTKLISYRVLRTALRSLPIKLFLKLAPPRWVFRSGLRASGLSRNFSSPSEEKKNRIREIYRRMAKQKFKKGFDVVLMGHTHVPDKHKELVGGRECWYINTGDWVENFTYVEFDGENFHKKQHPIKES